MSLSRCTGRHLLGRAKRSSIVSFYMVERTQVVGLPLLECWRFFSNPRNLSKITPPELRLRSHSELPSTIHPGLMFAYTFSPLLGVPITWLTEITHVDKPISFCDEQRLGPYRLWHHQHFFRSMNGGQTEVHDVIHYALRLGALGAIINAIAVRPQLERIFAFRGRVLAGL
jgi:ligand-binding SRPBCC domain-containing protein